MSTEIPIWVNGEIRWLSGIDKKTTCKDIVEALLDEKGIGKSEIKDFTIMERWRKVERPLDENSRILKIWSHWGDDKKEVRLCLRRVDNEVDSGRGSPIGSGGTPSFRRKRSRYRGIGKPPLAHHEGLHPRRLAELGALHRRDCGDGYCRNGKSFDLQDATKPVESNYDAVYDDDENLNSRRKSSAKSYHCPSTGKLHSTPLADHTNSRQHRKSGKCCSKRDSKHKVRNSESIEKLMKLILAQGATIQSQLQKLKERDEQIDIIEQERHRERIEKNGRNYLLETYLGSLKEAEIPTEMDEERADDSGVNTEGGSDQMNAIKRKNLEGLGQNETEIYSEPGRSDRRETAGESNEEPNLHHLHHSHRHHHHYLHHPMKNGRSKSESRTNESESAVAKAYLKRTLSDNSLAKRSESAGDPDEGLEWNLRRALKTKDDSDETIELQKIRSQIHMWEKVFKINKKLEKEEENLVRLHIKIKKIQNENNKFAKDAENNGDISTKMTEKEANEEGRADLRTNEAETSQEPEARRLANYESDQYDVDSDYAKIKETLKTLKSDLDSNSKEIYENFTKLIQEDEIVEKKRNCLTQLLSDLEKTVQEEEMLNEMIAMKQTQTFGKTDSRSGIPMSEFQSEAGASIFADGHAFLGSQETKVPVDYNDYKCTETFDDAPKLSGTTDQKRPEGQIDVQQKTPQFLKPKLVKISFEDTIKGNNNTGEKSQEKSIREPGPVTAGALKGILKNRTKSTPNRETDIYGASNPNEPQQTYPSNYHPNNHGSHNYNFYPNHNGPNIIRIPQPNDVPPRQDYNCPTGTSSTSPYNCNYSNNNNIIHSLYDANYASVPAQNHHDLKTAYSPRGLPQGSHISQEMPKAPHPQAGNMFPHSTIVKARVLNDNDSSTSSDTSGLCSMYSSSPSVEQPYVEHSYILDTLV